MNSEDNIAELRARLLASLPRGCGASLEPTDDGYAVRVHDVFDARWDVPFFARTVRGDRREIGRAVREAAEAAGERQCVAVPVPIPRLLEILGPHRGVPVGYAYDAYERSGLVAVVASHILSSRPPTGRPVAVFVGCDSVEWRDGLRESLRATLPDIEPPRGGDGPS